MNNFMYSYKDIVLQPSYSEIMSRKDINCKPTFLGKEFNSVAIPANMKCTIDFEKAVDFSEKGYFYILHRFYDYGEIFEWIKVNQGLITISISIGVQEKDYKLIDDIKEGYLRVDYITIDVAHGHHKAVKDIISHIKAKKLFHDPKIIAGNIGTYRAALDLKEWGADAVKVGLSMGKSCTTYSCTGVGTPMFSAVRSICFPPNPSLYFKYNPSLPVIADGQVREVGDVCKALVAGASMVMIGSEFAKCCDSPAETLDNHKMFYGSASSWNKESDNYIEGQKVLLEQRTENYYGFLKRINEGVQSCMSYAGTDELVGLQEMLFHVHY
jgi:GMP reductase